MHDAVGDVEQVFLKLASLVSLRRKVGSLARRLWARRVRPLWERRSSRRLRHGRISTTRARKQGINLIGYMRAEMGLGEAARGLARALQAEGIPFQTFNVERGNPSRHGDTSWIHKEENERPFDVNIVVVNPDNIHNVAAGPYGKMMRKGYTIAYWSWELPEIPDDWIPAFSCVDEVWGATRFVQEALSAKSPVPVYRVPLAIELPASGCLSRAHFGLPESAFIFTNMSDAQSYLQRKNPLGAVHAFQKAFSPANKAVSLVVKINNPARQPDYIERLRQEIEGWPNIFLFDAVMERSEIDSLLRLSDCYVSLHRAEGFGLAPAEAMSLGKPVILTNWSGNTDYMTSSNSLLVGYRLVELGEDYGPYQSAQFWAEPDLDDAANAMMQLVESPRLAGALGREALSSVRETLSPAAVGKRMAKRLRYLRQAGWMTPSVRHEIA